MILNEIIKEIIYKIKYKNYMIEPNKVIKKYNVIVLFPTEEMRKKALSKL